MLCDCCLWQVLGAGWPASDLSDATAGSKLDILPPESALFSTNYFYLWLHDGPGWVGGGTSYEKEAS